jgi:hypothetical protein
MSTPVSTLSTDQIKALGELIEAVRHYDDSRGHVFAKSGDARMYSAAVMCGQLDIAPEQVAVVLDGRQPMFPVDIDDERSLDLAYGFAGVER